ncbi:MAG: hypothetical protein HYY95_11360 [Candidatus Rokubacteria bacterium]|nr:hypothetical protein [Candidatus Rokubacteria bacterium]MBI3106152.1 hypothetical protein [Candidatus Rokubacteria bacterium]
MPASMRPVRRSEALTGRGRGEFLDRTGARCLRKPFAMAEIRRVIQEVLPPAT